MTSEPSDETAGGAPTGNYDRTLAYGMIGALFFMAVALWGFSLELGPEPFQPDEYSSASRLKEMGLAKFLERKHTLHNYQVSLTLLLTDFNLVLFRVPAVLYGLLCIPCLLYVSRRYNQGRLLAAAFACIPFIFNERLLYFFRWGHVSYSQAVLLGFLFLILLRPFVLGQETRKTILAVIFFSVLAPTHMMHNLPYLFFGVVAAFVVRFLFEARSARLSESLKKTIRAYLPWTPMVLSTAFICAVISPTALGGRRPTLNRLFFSTSSYPQTFNGAIDFLSGQTKALISGFFGLAFSFPHNWFGNISTRDIIFALFSLLFLSMMATLLMFFCKRCAPERLFIALYIVLSLTGIAILALLNQFPYGDIRYCLLLFAPVCLMLVYGLSDLGHVLCPAMLARKLPRTTQALRITVLVPLACVLLSLGQLNVCALHAKRSELLANQRQTLNAIRKDKSQIALVGHDALYGLAVEAPEFAARAQNIAYNMGTGWPTSEPSQELVEQIKNGESLIWSAIIVTYRDYASKTHPQYASLFSPEEWNVEKLSSSGRMFVTLFRRMDVRGNRGQ